MTPSGPPCLLDVNVLVALAWPTHVHQEDAHAWFAGAAPRGWATCPTTQCAFVRISSNPALIRGSVSPRQALSLLDRIVTLEHHHFWPDDVPFANASRRRSPAGLLAGHRQVTDAYLVGLAIAHGGRLATFDQRVASLLPDDEAADVLEPIPVGGR